MRLQLTLPAVITTAATALPAAESKSSCAYKTFKLTTPLYGAWGVGKYAHMLGDEFGFGTNDSSTAKTYSLDTATGELYDGTSLAYWQGLVGGHDAAVRFQSKDFIASTDGATIVSCKTPEANGDVLSCSGDGTSDGQYKQWDMCYENGGGIGLSLIEGNSTGPFKEPYPIRGWIYCGGLVVNVAELGCADAPAK